jgi:hypothetical protein
MPPVYMCRHPLETEGSRVMSPLIATHTCCWTRWRSCSSPTGSSRRRCPCILTRFDLVVPCVFHSLRSASVQQAPLACSCQRVCSRQRSTAPRNSSIVLSLVQDHNLFHVIQDKLLQVATGDPQRTVFMLVENSDKVQCVSP